MKYADVVARLESLPTSFRRQGVTYQQLENAFAASLARYTDSMDGLTKQETITNAAFVWLNMQGELYGIPRFQNESSTAYINRIQATLVAAKGTPVAIEEYIGLITGSAVTVTEQTSVPDWYLTVAGSSSQNLVNQINSSIGFVRPAGVPFYFSVLSGGLYVGTTNYFGYGRVSGSYLVAASTNVTPTINANTNNSQPLLPSTYLTDPTVNT
jgi:hypothetical protein